jgi:maleate cis-trans isomerase
MRDVKKTNSDSRPLKIGILYPLHSAEDDYPRLAAALDPQADVHIVHTDSPNVHEIEASRVTGRQEILAEGARQLREIKVDVCMWACTSGSFAFGLDGARTQAEALGNEVGVPASSTSIAFLHALQVLKLEKIAVAATYPERHSAFFSEFLREGGIHVLKTSSLGLWSADDVALVEKAEVLHFAAANDHHEAEAIIIPDTALHTAAFLEELEQQAGKTVLTANQVTMWEALRLGGYGVPQKNLGRLMNALNSR